MGNLVLHDEVMVHSASFHLAYEWRVFLFSVPAVAGVGQVPVGWHSGVLTHDIQKGEASDD